MSENYKERLLKEIDEFPEETFPKLYKILHVLRIELMQKTKRSHVRGSLKGIWKGSEIDDALFLQAKKSLFPYEAK